MSMVTNLSTVGSAELRKMSVREFTGGLENMSSEAIDRFRRMRKLSDEHTQALEKFLRANPDKRPQKADKNAKKSARGQRRAKKQTSPIPTGLQSTGKTTKKNEDGYVPILWRLQAWWEGVDIEVVKSKRGASKAVNTPRASRASTIEITEKKSDDLSIRWSDDRLDVSQRLWGNGFSFPGGAKYALSLNKYVALKPEMTYLDLTSGLGGGTRAVAKQHKLWLAGFEREKELAEAANDLSIDENMEQQAPIQYCDMDNLTLDENKYDVIFGREMFFSVDDKKKFLGVIALALKSEGNLLFTDFALTDRKRESDVLSAWRESEPFSPRPWTLDEYRQALNDLKYDVRVFEDVTDEYVPHIQEGWKRMVATLESGGLNQDFVNTLMDEANIWHNRVRALESGRLRLLRVHALMRRGPIRALSDPMKIN